MNKILYQGSQLTRGFFNKENLKSIDIAAIKITIIIKTLLA